MKKIPRITINRIELCGQPKSGAFRTAILNSLSQNAQRLWVWFTSCKKHSTGCVQDKFESHYEDLNTRRSLYCQTQWWQVFVMSDGASSSWKETGIFFFLRSKKVTQSPLPPLFFLWFFFFNFKYIKDNQKCICYWNVQISSKHKGCLFNVPWFFILALRREETMAGKVGVHISLSI